MEGISLFNRDLYLRHRGGNKTNQKEDRGERGEWKRLKIHVIRFRFYVNSEAVPVHLLKNTKKIEEKDLIMVETDSKHQIDSMGIHQVGEMTHILT